MSRKSDRDSVVDNALFCHLCALGSHLGQGMWQGSGRQSMVGSFLGVSSNTADHVMPSSGLEECIYILKFHEFSE